MKRNSQIELLRLFCILGITLHHLMFHSTIMEQPFGISRLFAQFFAMFGKSGVNIFVLISGYYLVGNSDIDYSKSTKRVFSIWKQMMIYSVLLGCTSILFLKEVFTFNKLLKMVFPTVTGHYWFMTAFIGLMILEPFLNKFAHNLSRADYQKLLIVLFFMMAVLPTNTWCNDLIWFITLYFTSGYIKLFELRWLTTQKRKMLTGISCFALVWLASIFLSILSTKIPAISNHINYFAFRQNNILQYIGSVAVFSYTIGKKPFYNCTINKIATHVLPCYLIQSNYFLSGKIWGFVDSVVPKQGVLYPIAAIGIVLALIILFMCIDVVVGLCEKGITSLLKKKSA